MSALACLLCGFFIDGGLSVHHSVDAPPPKAIIVTAGNAGEWEVMVPAAWSYDVNRTRNPYGVLALGYERDLNATLRVSLQLRHESSIAVNDHGTDSAQLTLRWRPFARRAL